MLAFAWPSASDVLDVDGARIEADRRGATQGPPVHARMIHQPVHGFWLNQIEIYFRSCSESC
jgi:hypothetical protein